MAGNMTTQIGLSAANFLLMAEGHLIKARDSVGGTEQPTRDYMAGEAIVRAIHATRHAMKLLKKEETCKKSKEF